jgi:uncharacterized protein (TIGR03083 family)
VTTSLALGLELDALHNSCNRLASVLERLPEDEMGKRSYADDWTIAQVASHLGSGAVIFGMFLDSGVAHTPAPGPEQFAPIWDGWNAKQPGEQVRDALIADAAFLERLGTLTPAQQEEWQLDLFGTEQSLAGLLRMRLSEHALHTWDIVVALEPNATVADDAAALIIDQLAGLVERAGHGVSGPISAHVVTANPEREFLLRLSAEGAQLSPVVAAEAGDQGAGTSEAEISAAGARLRLPAEAFIRLVYGRLDPAHTPLDVEIEGVDLDVLRDSFPGL